MDTEPKDVILVNASIMKMASLMMSSGLIESPTTLLKGLCKAIGQIKYYLIREEGKTSEEVDKMVIDEVRAGAEDPKCEKYFQMADERTVYNKAIMN